MSTYDPDQPDTEINHAKSRRILWSYRLIWVAVAALVLSFVIHGVFGDVLAGVAVLFALVTIGLRLPWERMHWVGRNDA
jgi:uncharacterized membrane protein